VSEDKKLDNLKHIKTCYFPNEWQLAELGEIFILQQGKALSQKNQTGKFYQPFLRTANVLWGHLDLNNVDQMDFTENEINRFALKPNDLLICEGGEIGRTAIWNGEFDPCFYQNHIHRLRLVRPDVEPQFVMYWMQAAIKILGLYEGEGNKTTIPNLSKARLSRFLVPLPPLPEQRAIARALRTVQAARDARMRELALERERKASLMERLFVQDNCKVMLLDECAFVQTGVAKGRKFENENNKINVPYLRVANVQDGYLDLEEIQTIEIRQSELKRFLLQPGDILLTEGGDFDKLGRGFIWQGQISQCVHQNHIFAVRVNKSLLIPEYLAYLIQSEYGKAYFLSVAHRTTHLACINSTKLKAFPTLKPDLGRQKEIVDVLGACDSKIAALDHEARLHEELFRAMLEELMSGRLLTKSVIESHFKVNKSNIIIKFH